MSSLDRLLHKLQLLLTHDLFSYSVIVVDNDHMASAHAVVAASKALSRVAVTYLVEPKQNIALARNKAVNNALGDYIAFIDDDEWPATDWLLNLFKILHTYHASGVLGPVIPHYDVPPPRWILKGRFYDRPSHQTGTLLSWTYTRTGNVLLRRDVFNTAMFRPAFGSGGEDRDLFRELINHGHRFVWCADAVVYESVPPARYKRSFMLRRALLRGKIPCHRPFDIIKSFIAIPIYTMFLPVLLLLGHHVFMKYLVKNFDHIGRLLALCNIDLIKDKYILH
jgi:glycosyltransferase involved in cell wall biosynthesis